MRKKLLLVTVLVLISSLFVIQTQFVLADAPSETLQTENGVDLAYGRRVVATEHTDDNTNVKAVDNDSTTRYASADKDDAYFYIDLGSVEKVNKIVIDWETAFAKEYEIQMSKDAITWTTVAKFKNEKPTVDEIIFPEYLETQFVKFQGIERGTNYGYSFWSFEVYGAPSLALDSEVLEVSSNENETDLNKSFMVDNDASTRWASEAQDNQYFILDLKEPKTFDLIKTGGKFLLHVALKSMHITAWTKLPCVMTKAGKISLHRM